MELIINGIDYHLKDGKWYTHPVMTTYGGLRGVEREILVDEWVEVDDSNLGFLKHIQRAYDQADVVNAGREVLRVLHEGYREDIDFNELSDAIEAYDKGMLEELRAREERAVDVEDSNEG